MNASSRLSLLSWLHFLNDGSANYLPGVLPAVLLDLHEKSGLAGSLMAALLIGQAMQAPLGWLADRWGGKQFIIMGLLGSSVGGALIGWSSTIWMLIPVLFFIGMGNATFHPQALAAARSQAGSRGGLGLSFFLIGGELGRGLWPWIASVVVVYLGLHALWLLALPALLSIVLFSRSLPSMPTRNVLANRIDWKCHRGPLVRLIAVASLRALVIYGLVTYLPILWHEHGHSLTEGAALVTVLLGVGIIGNLGGGHLADVFPRRLVLMESLLGAGLLLGLFLVTSGFFQWVVLALQGILLFASLPLTVLIGQDIFPENRSLGSGLALGFSNGLAAAMLIAGGLIVDHFSIDLWFWVLVGCSFVAALLSLTLPK